MKKSKIDWINFHTACFHTARRILEDDRQIDTIIALARGGLVPARIMAEYIEPDNFYVMGLNLYDNYERGEAIRVYQDVPSHRIRDRSSNILVIDDISDGGSTLDYVYNEFKRKAPKAKIITATPYIKTGTKFVPDYYVTEFPNDTWIVFPFEKDED
tara:strand:+ start:12750 stop:13220 length:471 start_codon:yes stop_codon:yes gene_type:complete